MLASKYELERRKRYEYGYQLFTIIDDDIVEHRIFKMFDHVREWLEDKHWTISWKFQNWQAYVGYIFDMLKPQIPQPPQLKNEYLLRSYLSLPATSKQSAKIRSDEQMLEIYKKVIPAEYIEICLGSFAKQ